MRELVIKHELSQLKQELSNHYIDAKTGEVSLPAITLIFVNKRVK